jgi:hypothetical protein
MSNLTNKYINALKKRYESQIAEAEANIALYLSGQNLAAIGEHSDLMEEQDKWIGKLAEAKDKLETLLSLDLGDPDMIKKINS